jgi:hypothetical protein
MGQHHEHEGCVVEQLTAGDQRLRDGAVREGGTSGPPLRDVTPGLDPVERVRTAALKAVLWTRALSRDVAAVIDKGVEAAGAEAKAAWQRWSPPAKTEAPPASSAAADPAGEAATAEGMPPPPAPSSDEPPPSHG